MIEIPLPCGFVTLIDDEDYDLVVAGGPWHAYQTPVSRTHYVQGHVKVNGRDTTRHLHSFLTGWSRVDHQNGNGLDNQRSNLRPATAFQNQGNRRLNRNSTSGYKGVTLRKRGGSRPWTAQINIDYKHIYIGAFASPEIAARAYDAAAILHFGEFARLNFPGEISA